MRLPKKLRDIQVGYSGLLDYEIIADGWRLARLMTANPTLLEQFIAHPNVVGWDKEAHYPNFEKHSGLSWSCVIWVALRILTNPEYKRYR